MLTQKQETIEIPIHLENEEQFPCYASEGAAGADVKAFLTEDLIIPPGKSALVPTGMKMEIPEGYEVQVRPRSGLALKFQVTVLNTPGTIDSDYRGPVNIILINHGNDPFVVTPGMRIAQLIVAPVVQARWVVSTNPLSCTARGEKGFGHTGTH